MRWSSCLFSILVLVTAGGCASSRFSPGDPENPNRMVVVVGTLDRIDEAPEASVSRVLWVVPRAEHRGLLDDDRTAVPCAITVERSARFETSVALLRVGQPIEVSGWWVRDEQAGGRWIRPVTAIDRLVK